MQAIDGKSLYRIDAGKHVARADLLRVGRLHRLGEPHQFVALREHMRPQFSIRLQFSEDSRVFAQFRLPPPSACLPPRAEDGGLQILR